MILPASRDPRRAALTLLGPVRTLCAQCRERDFSSANKALFRCEKILNFATVALSFVSGKYCLGSKDSSRDLQVNCAISFYFRLYLMLHTCVERFDVTRNLEKIFVFGVN